MASIFAILDDGHHRQLPRLIKGKTFANDNFNLSNSYEAKLVKQAVIATSMIYLTYPLKGEVESYPESEFEKDFVTECLKDIRVCFEAVARSQY
jgi:hypothetical protein